MASRLRALRVVHPFPSFLNASLVLALALIAGASVSIAAVLAVGMLGIQFCIGSVNDLRDVDLDARIKPWKPIVAGLISAASVRLIAIVAASVAILTAVSQGPVVTLLALVMLGAGLVYDLWLKRTLWAWACFSVAFACLPVYAWYGAASVMPPLSQFLIPLAALAGPALQLSNGLVDLERDRAGGIETLATRLGQRRVLATVALLLVVIYSVAWATLAADTEGVAGLAVTAATGLAIAGWLLLAAARPALRSVGWTAQATAIALLAAGWVAAI